MDFRKQVGPTPNTYFANNVLVKFDVVNEATFFKYHYFNPMCINKNYRIINQSLANGSSAYSFYQCWRKWSFLYKRTYITHILRKTIEKKTQYHFEKD